jgi:protein-tyrosine-phosphatase
LLNILFVCTGNTCRSPLAEGILNYYARESGLKVTVRSAGIHAQQGAPISAHSKAILQEMNCPAQSQAKLLNKSEIDWATYIFTMTTQHKQTIIQHYAESIDKIYTLKEFVNEDDQIKKDLEERDQLIVQLQVDRILSEASSNRIYERLQELEKNIPSKDIPDPYGGNIETYREISNELKQLILQFIEKVKKRNH